MSPVDVDGSLSNALSSPPNVTAPLMRSPISNSSLNPNPSSPSPSPSSDLLEDLLLDCRYGERDPVSQFVETYGVTTLANARDERGNNVLHMCAANGHDDILTYILSLLLLPPTLIASGNDAGSTPLHWACLNAQLACAKRLVAFRPFSCLPPNSDSNSAPPDFNSKSKSEEGLQELDDDTVRKLGLGPALIFTHNAAGHTPLGEAERAGWDEGARWLVSVMDLQLDFSPDSEEADVDVSCEEVADAGVEVKRIEEGERDGDGKDGDGDEEVEVELARLRVSDGDLSNP